MKGPQNCQAEDRQNDASAYPDRPVQIDIVVVVRVRIQTKVIQLVVKL